MYQTAFMAGVTGALLAARADGPAAGEDDATDDDDPMYASCVYACL
jgi:hypothetical protein